LAAAGGVRRWQEFGSSWEGMSSTSFNPMGILRKIKFYTFA
jgi:hypothetical protein